MMIKLLYKKYKTLLFKSLAALIPALSFVVLTTDENSVIFEIVLDQIIYHSFYLVFLKLGSTQIYLEATSIKDNLIQIPKDTLNTLMVVGGIIIISDFYWIIIHDTLRFGFLLYVIQLFAEYIRINGKIHEYFFTQAPLNHVIAWSIGFIIVKQNKLALYCLIASALFGIFLFFKFKSKHITLLAKKNRYKQIILGFSHSSIQNLINWAPITFFNTFFDFSISSKVAFIFRSANLVNFYLLGEMSKFPSIFKSKKKINLKKFQRDLFKSALPSLCLFSLLISCFIYLSFNQYELITSLTVVIIGFLKSQFFGVALISNLLNQYSIYIRQMIYYLITLSIISFGFYLFKQNTIYQGCLYLLLNTICFVFYRRRILLIITRNTL